MNSGEIEVNQVALTRLILEAKIGNDHREVMIN